MKKVLISEEAYTEFKSFLDENNIDNYNIRIEFGGYACSGAVFNISIDQERENDTVEQIHDIKFIVNNELIEEFGGFSLLSSDENEGRGLSLKPHIQTEGGCGTCGGCH